MVQERVIALMRERYQGVKLPAYKAGRLNGIFMEGGS